MRKFLRELFWKRCHFCNHKRKYFYWLWETHPDLYSELSEQLFNENKHTLIYEICTECVTIKQKEYESTINPNA